MERGSTRYILSLLLCLSWNAAAWAGEPAPASCREHYKPEVLFHPGRGTRVVVTLSDALRQSLLGFAQQELAPQMRRTGLRPEDLQVVYVPCPMRDHAQARELGRALGADLLLWGDARHGAVTLVSWRGPEDGGADDAPDLRWAMELDCPSPADSPALLRLVLGLYAFRAQHYGMAAGYLEQSRDGAFPAPAQVPWSLLSLVGASQILGGMPQKGLMALTDASGRCPAGAGSCPASTLHNLGWAQGRAGERPRALELYQQALAQRPKDDPLGRSMTLNNLAMLKSELSEPEEAGKLLLEARMAAEQGRSPRWHTLSLDHAGAAHFRTGDRAAALADFQQAQQAAHEGEYVYGEVLSLGHAGEVYRRQGQGDRARGLHRQALLLAHGSDAPLEGQALHDLGRDQAHSGNHREALASYLQALELLPQDGDLSVNAAVLRSTAEAYRELRDPARALRFYREAVANIERAGAADELAQYLAGLATLLEERGRDAEAVEAYRRAAEKYFAQHDPERAAGSLDLAFRLALRGRRLAACRQIIAELGEHGMDLFLAVKEAQLRNLTGPRDEAAAAYKQLDTLAQKLPPEQAGVFATIAEAGLSRLQHRAAFGRCPGVVAIRPVEEIRAGDILLRHRRTCLSHAEDLEAVAARLPGMRSVPVRIYRNGQVLTLKAPADGLDRAVTDF